MKQISRTHAVIWDMGGVLLRTIDPTSRIKLAEQAGMDRFQLENLFFSSETAILAEKGQILEEQHWERVLEMTGLQHMGATEFRSRFFAGDRLDSVLIEFIQELRKGFRTGLLSNAWKSARNNVSGQYSFLDAFDVSVFSAEVGVRKPGAEIYRIMLKRLEIQPAQAIFIDDMLANVEGARAVGMRAVRYENTQQIIQEINELL